MPHSPVVDHPVPETGWRRRQQDRQLFARYRRDRDAATRDALVHRFLPLANHLARGYDRGTGYGDDLSQVAALGLLKAIERYDPDRGIAFSSFAVPTISGEIKRYFRDKGWIIRVPRDLQERALAVQRASEDLESELGRVPTTRQLADRLGTTVESVLEARTAAGAHFGISLDRQARAATRTTASWPTSSASTTTASSRLRTPRRSIACSRSSTSASGRSSGCGSNTT